MTRTVLVAKSRALALLWARETASQAYKQHDERDADEHLETRFDKRLHDHRLQSERGCCLTEADSCKAIDARSSTSSDPEGCRSQNNARADMIPSLAAIDLDFTTIKSYLVMTEGGGQYKRQRARRSTAEEREGAGNKQRIESIRPSLEIVALDDEVKSGGSYTVFTTGSNEGRTLVHCEANWPLQRRAHLVKRHPIHENEHTFPRDQRPHRQRDLPPPRTSTHIAHNITHPGILIAYFQRSFELLSGRTSSLRSTQSDAIRPIDTAPIGLIPPQLFRVVASILELWIRDADATAIK
ncbi:hypothetical protein DOTSEDRAFT_37551 [Dothistroma septosporum NZE10]|uniref:Uncharacterized protein n=1 Tax=Dothistroma septosporum (strain NZE10 / CBS 128990) TaxID=675120 RepID=N1PEL3_DOTSN|nr:hypothetical protein DOTSEDRAFT_37551 [Dothistroma septosporum NZE10]